MRALQIDDEVGIAIFAGATFSWKVLFGVADSPAIGCEQGGLIVLQALQTFLTARLSQFEDSMLR